jgi:hypothetical protein
MGAERSLALLLLLVLAAACATPRAVSPRLQEVATKRDALATSDALEALIADGRDTTADREYAYQAVTASEEDTAAYAFARAAVTGRLVQQRGLLGANLVPDVERWALRSRELDPDFRGGAATRLLGTLYVISPASFLRQGDSEQGIELLEGLVREHPDVVENHLRLAEAYVALGDPGPAAPQLCFCLSRRSALRQDDQQLLDQLIATAGQPSCVTPR